MLVARPWFLDICRAPKFPTERSILCMEKHSPTANLTGLEDCLGQGGEVPFEGGGLLWRRFANGVDVDGIAGSYSPLSRASYELQALAGIERHLNGSRFGEFPKGY